MHRTADRPCFFPFGQTFRRCRVDKTPGYGIGKIVGTESKPAFFPQFGFLFGGHQFGKTPDEIRRRRQPDHAPDPFRPLNRRQQRQPAAHRRTDADDIAGQRFVDYLKHLLFPDFEIGLCKIFPVRTVAGIVKTKQTDAVRQTKGLDRFRFSSPAVGTETVQVKDGRTAVFWRNMLKICCKGGFKSVLWHQLTTHNVNYTEL